MKILVIQSTNSGVYYHRQWAPHYTWLDSGDEFKDDGVVIVENRHMDKLRDVLDSNRFDIIQYSVAIVQPQNMVHIIGNKEATMIDFIRSRDKGAKIILDIDDRYSGARRDVVKSIRDADALTVTCDNLKEYFLERGSKPCLVIENGIDSKEEQWKFRKPKNDQVVFGYVGSTRHEQDLKEMRYDFSTRPLYSACEEYKEILKVDFYGGLSSWADYAYHYDRLDVALAPIENNMFNKSKSNLKIIEAGFMKKAIICSKIEPYTRDKSLYPAIDLIPKKNSWKQRVESYTLDEARQRGEELYNLVQKYEIRELNKKRREFYQKVLDGK